MPVLQLTFFLLNTLLSGIPLWTTRCQCMSSTCMSVGSVVDCVIYPTNRQLSLVAIHPTYRRHVHDVYLYTQGNLKLPDFLINCNWNISVTILVLWNQTLEWTINKLEKAPAMKPTWKIEWKRHGLLREASRSVGTILTMLSSTECHVPKMNSHRKAIFSHLPQVLTA